MMTRPLGCFCRSGLGTFVSILSVLLATGFASIVDAAGGAGDFESGNLLPPFNSLFTRSNDMTVSNSWNIVSQDTLNPNWADFYDHTLGNTQGHFFVANGTPGVQDYMLSMTVPVARNTSYSLSGWVAALSSDPTGALGIRIFAGAGVLSAGEFSMSSPAGVWQPFTLNFNSFNSDFLGIYFFKAQNLQANALALDDIQLVPEPGSIALLLIGVLSCAASCVARRRSRS